MRRHMFLKELIVARKGAKRPIFEGNMPPKKMYPRKKCTPNIGANIGAITGILLTIRPLQLRKSFSAHNIHNRINMIKETCQQLSSYGPVNSFQAIRGFVRIFY
jgi:hypothetical protein